MEIYHSIKNQYKSIFETKNLIFFNFNLPSINFKQDNNVEKRSYIYIDGKEKTDEVLSYSFVGDKCTVIYKNNSKSYSYNQNKIQIIKSATQDKKAEKVFNYLREIANTSKLFTDKGKNILAGEYEKISFIPECSVLSYYLTGTQPDKNSYTKPIEIFPFGFNLSQKTGVHKAFSNPLSVIEGPPGTGKTQTILNIIANAIMTGQTVAIVSNNNSAIENIYEKLEKNDIAFIAASLGSRPKRKKFVESQIEIPDLSAFKISEEQELVLQESNTKLFFQLTENLGINNELASLKMEIENINTEYKHFTKDLKTVANIEFKTNITSDQLLSLWIKIENLEKSGKKFNWWKKLTFPFRYGIKDKSFYDLSYQEMIRVVQSAYYPSKISELDT